MANVPSDQSPNLEDLWSVAGLTPYAPRMPRTATPWIGAPPTPARPEGDRTRTADPFAESFGPPATLTPGSRPPLNVPRWSGPPTPVEGYRSAAQVAGDWAQKLAPYDPAMYGPTAGLQLEPVAGDPFATTSSF